MTWWLHLFREQDYAWFMRPSPIRPGVRRVPLTPMAPVPVAPVAPLPHYRDVVREAQERCERLRAARKTRDEDAAT